MATKLYPPIIDESLPAFYKKNNTYTITIPFEMNKTVGYAAISGFALKLRTILGGFSILKNDEIKSNIYNITTNEVTFIIVDSNVNVVLNEGQFYKAQIAYYQTINSQDVIGYYSTVGIIKCIAKPTVEIEGYNTSNINLFSNTYIGKYTQNSEVGDCSEKVYSYQFNIYDKDHNLFASSGEQIHNTSQDEAENYSIDKFIFRKIVTPYEVYYIQYSVTTINGLKVSSPFYHISATETLDMKNAVTIIPKNIAEHGYISISFLDDKNKDYTGMYLLAKSADNGVSWEEVQRFEVLSTEKYLHTHIIKDNLIEQGVTYIYSLQEFNKYEVFTNRIYSDPILADYEDMYLLDKDRTLKIRFNPKVSSFKNDIPEQKIETIGSKYPFIFRNGNVYYKEFPVAGLLSFQLDNALDFLNEQEQEESGILEEISHRKYTGNLNQWQEPRVENHLDKQINLARNSTDPTDLNIYTERYFKLKVLEWLNNGQPKLFKSSTEGMYIVRLLNVSLSPEDKLGRMLHNFTSTAYEVAELNLQNLSDLNLIPTLQIQPFYETKKGELKLQPYTLNTTNYLKNGRSFISYLKGSTVKNLEFIDFCPGDEITIVFTNNEKSTYIIGASKELHILKEDRTIADVIVKANPQYITYNTFQRIIKYEYDIIVSTDFDNYTQITTVTLPCLSLPYHNKTITFDPNAISSSTIEPAVFSADDFYAQNGSVKIPDATSLKKYLGFSFYIDSNKTKPKILIKHIDQIIITKRQIVPVYRNPEASNQYLLDVFGHGFLNDRFILQDKVQNNNLDEIKFTKNNYRGKDLPFEELRKKDGVDVFTFQAILNNFLNDRFSIIQIYVYNEEGFWVPLNGNNCYIPSEGIGAFSLTENDWKYKINEQDFIAIPNSFNEGTIENNKPIINTSTYVKVIDIDRFNDTLIPCISAGRGVCIDIVPQYLVYNYTAEDSTAIIRNAKQIYLENKTLDNLYNYLKSLEGI